RRAAGRLRRCASGAGQPGRARAPGALRGMPPRLRARVDDDRDMALPARTHARALRAARDPVAHARRGARAHRIPRRARRHELNPVARGPRVVAARVRGGIPDMAEQPAVSEDVTPDQFFAELLPAGLAAPEEAG